MRIGLFLCGVFMAGCGPKLPPDEVDSATGTAASTGGMTGDEAGTSGDATPTTGATAVPEPNPSTTDAPDPDTGTTAPPDPTGEPAGPCPDVNVDPFDRRPYLLCRGGIAEIVAVQFAGGEVGFYAYAQFFRVFAESQVVWDETVHDPFEGPGDCGARTIGNSGSGEAESVLWEDAGDLTFLGPDFSVPGEKSGDPQSVIGYDGSLSNLGLTPNWGASYGLQTTGATTPALDLPMAVHLPDRIEVQSPALTGAVVDREAVEFLWTPSPLGLSTWLFLNFEVPEGSLAIVCDMGDDGEFTVPADLLALAPLPATARVMLTRRDVRTHAIDDDRALRYEGRVDAEGELQIE